MVKNLKKKKGFTLIELIIVIAILGILAAIAIPKFSGVQNNSKIKADKASAKILADTASMLLVQGKLKETSGAIASADIKTAVSAELHKYPTPQALGTNFVITYTAASGTDATANTGTFTVEVDDSTTTPTQVYPNGTGIYVN